MVLHVLPVLKRVLVASLIVFTAACSGSAVEVETCAARAMKPGGAKQGFELIDLPSGEVWLTRDWSVDEFAALDLPLSWSLWRKNDPRTGVGRSGRFLRSPGCEPGHFTYMKALGREFLHVVDLNNFGVSPEGTQGLVNAVSLTKHHEVNWEAGAKVDVLTDPEGQRFVLVARTVPVPSTPPTIPSGWTLDSGKLEAPLSLSLDGAVQVLRMDNEDSFQGPVPADTAITLAD